MQKILIFTKYFYPGFKAGGPIQSINNFVKSMDESLEIFVFTTDRDFLDQSQYPGISVEQWVEYNNALIYYCSPQNLKIKTIRNILRSVNYDKIYLNSFFDFYFSIAIILIKLLFFRYTQDIVLAPRGEFSKGALGIKTIKKRIYISVSKLLNFYRRITWHATNSSEAQDIISIFGKNINVNIIQNFPKGIPPLRHIDGRKNKEEGHLDVIFLSRIARMKNLSFALKVLKNVSGYIDFDIYGPVDDVSYWKDCQQLMQSLPDNINVDYMGVLDHSKVVETFKEYDLFFLPTLGENHGHVINEALLGGCPVLISDQTPWKDLDKENAGWNVPLSNRKKFEDIINFLVDQNQDYYIEISKGINNYIKKISNTKYLKKNYYSLFSN